MNKKARKLERARLEKMFEEFNTRRLNCTHKSPDGTIAVEIIPNSNARVRCQLCTADFDISIIEEITCENIEDVEHQLRILLDDLPEYLLKYDKFKYNEENKYKDELIQEYKRQIALLSDKDSVSK